MYEVQEAHNAGRDKNPKPQNHSQDTVPRCHAAYQGRKYDKNFRQTAMQQIATAKNPFSRKRTLARLTIVAAFSL